MAGAPGNPPVAREIALWPPPLSPSVGTGVSSAQGSPAAPALDAGNGPPPAPSPAPGGQPTDAAWATGFGIPALPSDVLSVVVSGQRVFIGGNFFYGMAGTANDTFVRIAMWDGTGWRPLGTGLDGAVNAIVVVGDDVYAGGDFTVAGGTLAAHLARWDGETWSAVAGGVSDPDRSYGTTVRALASDGTTLFVGGVFTRAGDVPVRSLAALDLRSGAWSDAAGGVASSWSSEPAEVRALAVHDGSLYVGGAFDVAGETSTMSFARLDVAASAWEGYGTGVTDDGMQGFVNTLAVDPGGVVYLGGRFTSAGGTRSWNLAALRDGAFTSLGDVSSYGGKYAEVFALAVCGRALYAGGSFTSVGNAVASSFARFDGTAWSLPGDGVDNVVKALAALGDDAVVVVGDFTASGELRVVHGGIWTTTGWRTFGQGVTSDPFGGGAVHAVVPTGAGAYVGGLFDQAGQLRVGSVAHWTGENWEDMAGGVGAAYSHGQVFAMAQVGDDLYVAGQFNTAGGVVLNNIARWDGAGWFPLAEGLDDAAYAMTVLGGKLYVGGTFNVAGRVAAGHLACWDPTIQVWSAVGNAPTYDDDIKALATIGDRWLVVGGTFQRFFSGGTTIVEGLWGMTLFDTAQDLTDDVLSGYHLLEGTSRYGAPGWVHTLHVLDGDLYVGGWFDVAGIMALGDKPSPGFPAANLAVWHFADADGRWEPCGDADHQVQALTSRDGTLAAGGWFSHVGRAPAARVATYDPAARAWQGLGSGLSDGARGASWALSLGWSASGLWVGGQFPCAGGSSSGNLALWRDDAAPAE